MSSEVSGNPVAADCELNTSMPEPPAENQTNKEGTY